MVSVLDNLGVAAAQFGSKIALINDARSITFEDLHRNAAAVGYSLRHELDLEPGDVVGLWGANTIEWVEVFAACSAIGVSCVLMSTGWTITEAESILADAGAKALIHDIRFTARATTLAHKLPSLRHLVPIDATVGFNLAQLRALAPKEAASFLQPPPAGTGRPLFFTSGTTGSRSKLVIRTGTFQRMLPMDELFGLSASDRTLCVTPFFHGNGNAAVFETLKFGGSVVFPTRFSPNRFWSIVDQHRPTFFFSLMPILSILLAREPSPAEAHNSLTKIMALGLAPFAETIAQRFGVRVFDWYGGTEIGGCVVTPLDEPNRPGATGKVMPGRHLFIVDDELNVCQPGTIGQVAVPRDEIAFGGYAGEEEDDGRPYLSGEYFLTGDLGYFDDDGWFFFVDRVKDIVRRGGENIASIEVEAALQDQPDIEEVAIVPRPDAVLGERVTAFVVPRSGRPVPTAAQLRAFASGRIATYKMPDMVIAIDVLPRTATGKVQKAGLKAIAAGREPITPPS